MRILGIDPGYGRLGWGLIDSEAMLDCGYLETRADLSEAGRLVQLFTGLEKLIKRFKPAAAAAEKLFYFKNQTTVIGVAQSRGVALLAAGINSLPVYSYTPLQIKQAVTGYGRAEKSQVQQMVKSILNLPAVPRPDDAADALAVALTHLFSYKFKSKVK